MIVFNFQDFLINFGYLAVFVLTFMRSLGITVFLPIPQVVVIPVAVSLGLNPLFVGLIAGLTSTFGDALAYFAGLGGRKILFKRKKIRVPSKLRKVLKRGSFWSVLIASLTPLPLVYGFAVGSFRYDINKFILASLTGKLGGSLFIAYGAFYGLGIIKG